MQKIVIYTSPSCHKCKKKKEELKEQLKDAYNDTVVVIDVSKDSESLALLTMLGYMSLPVVAVFND